MITQWKRQAVKGGGIFNRKANCNYVANDAQIKELHVVKNINLNLRVGLEVGGAPLMWERVLREALPEIRKQVPAGSKVLEVGYGDGLLSCYLCKELGWKIVGLEVSKKSHSTALEHAQRFGLAKQIDFYCCAPEDICNYQGNYDAVFIKTVLYNSSTLYEYAKWLDWIASILRPGGVFINFETGRANGLTQIYRRLRQRSYTTLCLYTGEVETLYDERFEIIERRYYGGLSQFFALFPPLYFLISRIEEVIQKRHANNSFIVSIIARRPIEE